MFCKNLSYAALLAIRLANDFASGVVENVKK